MDISNILDAIDSEISRLQGARALLIGEAPEAAPAKRRGRPKGSTNNAKSAVPAPVKATKRTLSEEGKARIAAAQKARWAAAKKAAAPATKIAGKKSAKRVAAKKRAPQAAPVEAPPVEAVS